MSTPRPHKPYPSDVSDDEWEFAAPYLTLITPEALQRTYDLRDVFNAVRWLARTDAPWRYLPGDFPPWPAVYQQARRWLDARCFEALVHELRLLLRVPATTGTNGAKGPRCMRRSIRWATCWR